MSFADMGLQSYLFTQGLLGKNKDGKIILSVGSFSYETNANFELNYKDIFELENMFNIKLVGLYFPEASYMARNLAIDELIALSENGEFWSFHNIVREVGVFLSEIRYNLRLLIFKNTDIANLLIDRVSPAGLLEGGISDGISISKDDFEQLFQRITWSDETYKHKLIYYYDVISIIDDFQNHFVNIGHRFLSAESELHNYLSGILKQVDPFPKLNGNFIDESESCEYMLGGWQTHKIHQLYMDCIIGLYSLLDVFCKVAFELCNLPTNYERTVKLNHNGRYFTDLDRLTIPTMEGADYTNTIFNKLADYKELSLLRHEFVHSSSLSPLPNLFYGKKTDVVNNKPICYACCFLWDIDVEGKPVRWKNRRRFYSQKKLVDHYILKWTQKVSIDLFYTVSYLKDYMDSLAKQVSLQDNIDLATAFPSYRED